MTKEIDPLLKKILDAPVGQVVKVLENALNSTVTLEVVEQTSQKPGTEFVRKATITADELPVIKADVKFDSNIIPEPILAELLKKQKGIGEILIENKIIAKRNVEYIHQDDDGRKISRKYDIVYNDSIWFTIFEEIRLDHINSRKNC